MNWKKVEKRIIDVLTKKVEALDYTLCSEDYSSPYNHLITYEKKAAYTTFYLQLRFMVPNYLKLQVQFSATNALVNEFYQRTCKLPEESLPIYIMNFDVEDFISAQQNNKEAFGFYITDDTGYAGVDTQKVAQQIVDRYFLYVEQAIVSRFDRIEELEGVINAPEHFTKDGLIGLSAYCFPIQSQVLGGVALARLCKKPGYEEVIARYLNYCTLGFKKGEDEDIDALTRCLEQTPKVVGQKHQQRL